MACYIFQMYFEETIIPDDVPLKLEEIKQEIIIKCNETKQRGLNETSKWLSELLYALRDVKTNNSSSFSKDDSDDIEVYYLSKSYFDLQEYDRCAFHSKRAQTPRLRFLHYYSRYLSGEKKKLDNLTDAISPADNENQKHLVDLRTELELCKPEELDGYCLYLYGIVLKKLELNDLARSCLLESIHKEPGNWSAWLEFSSLVSDRHKISTLELPDHWMKHFFLAHTYLELQLSDKALALYLGLQNAGLKDSTYILAQIGIAFHNNRDVDKSLEYFRELSEMDPYRLDNLDIYSNMLYVKQLREELAHLAHRTVEIDKYRTETCCVIGNYYSLRSEHEKSLTYFQRALRLNPNYHAALTLIGHEFIELKNTNAAIQSYRRALEVNKRDYRAWYGLGQTYEMLKMPFYSLYYYKKAQELRPNDSRMLIALGETYDKLDKLNEAKKCFWRAHCVGDAEGGSALFQLAKLFEKTNDTDQAAAAYHQYIINTEAEGISERDRQSSAFRFLAKYYLKKGQWDDAYLFGQRCCEFADTKEEGKAILKEISTRRVQPTNQERTPGPVSNADQANLPSMNLDFTPNANDSI